MESPTTKAAALSCVSRKCSCVKHTRTPAVIMPPKEMGGLEWSPEQPKAQGVHSRAVPWAPAGCTQAKVRTNHSHNFGTGPLFTALSQHLKPGKGEVGLI